MNRSARDKIRALHESWTPAQVTAVLGYPGHGEPIPYQVWKAERYEGEWSDVPIITIQGLVEREIVAWVVRYHGETPLVQLTEKGRRLKKALLEAFYP